MQSNFNFLQHIDELKGAYEKCLAAEKYVSTDPDASGQKQRQLLERIVKF